MHRDIKYIIKRIIIGVGIGLVLGFINNLFVLDVRAAVWSDNQGQKINVISNTDQMIYHGINGAFAGRSGDINFSFSLFKVSGEPTAPVLMAYDVRLLDSSSTFPCSIGTSSLTNSTFGGTSYSVSCPVSVSSSGITRLEVRFTDNQQNSTSSYRFVWSGLWSIKEYESLDTSSTNSAINNTTNAINNQTSSINNNINSNTNKIINSNKEIKDAISDDNVSQSQSQASNFFGNFQSNSHGLSGILSSPLRLIQSLASEECSPLTFPLPFVNKNVTLNCMSTIYTTYFGVFFTLYQLITTGLISYWILIRLFSKVKDFQNPNSDKVEVFDL